MKKIVMVVIMVMLAAGIFAEGTSEISNASAALINELTATVQEGKGVVSEYAPLGVDGLVKAKRAYFDIVFPLVPLLMLVGVGIIGLGLFFLFLDDWDADDIGFVGTIVIFFGCVVILILGIWSISATFNMRIFEAAPEVYVIKSLIGK